MLAEITAIIAAHKNALRKVCSEIYRNPEIGPLETKAAALQAVLLRDAGFTVQAGIGPLPTAFKSSFGAGKPTFCFMSEYDALPDLGHACGHNLIAVAALAAGMAVRELIEKKNISGQIVIMGTPAEEKLGGKITLLANNAFAGIDAFLICHPFNATGRDPGCLAVSQFDISFKGKAAHASCQPEAGRNALDALNLVFAGINAYRQHIPESARIHGIISRGGSAPNIVPEYAEACFFLRAADKTAHAAIEQRFRDIAQGAALMTGTKARVRKLPGTYYSPNLPNQPLNDCFMTLAREAGLEPEEKILQRISSDYANVSEIIPGINMLFSITQGGNYQLHSQEFKAAAGTGHAFEQAMKIAAVMAAEGWRFLTDEKFRGAVTEDFRKRTSK